MKRKLKKLYNKEVINLNIGGTRFAPACATILSKPDTKLAKIINSINKVKNLVNNNNKLKLVRDNNHKIESTGCSGNTESVSKSNKAESSINSNENKTIINSDKVQPSDEERYININCKNDASNNTSNDKNNLDLNNGSEDDGSEDSSEDSDEDDIDYDDIDMNQEFYFERNPQFFPLILQWYRTGKFPISRVKSKELDSLYSELCYWNIILSPEFKKLKTYTVSRDDRIIVECFIDNFFKCDILYESEERYYDLFLQDNPKDIVNRMYNDETKDIIEIKDHFDPEISINENIKEFIKGFAKENNYPLDPNMKLTHNQNVVNNTIEKCRKIKDLHPLIRNIYKLLYFYIIDEIGEILKNKIQEKNLVTIIYDYTDSNMRNYDFFDSNDIEQYYLPNIFAIYYNVLSGAKLFDDDKVQDISFLAREYAVSLIQSRGIKAEWRKKHIICKGEDEVKDLYSRYPYPNYKFISLPLYKCEICSIKKWSKLIKIKEHCNEFDIWYLHFEW